MVVRVQLNEFSADYYEINSPKSKRRNNKYPYWFPLNRKDSCRQGKIRARHKQHTNPRELTELKLLTAWFHKYIARSYSQHINGVKCSIRVAPNTFWASVKETHVSSPSIPREMMNDAKLPPRHIRYLPFMWGNEQIHIVKK